MEKKSQAPKRSFNKSSSLRPKRSSAGAGFQKPYRRDADQGKMVYVGNLKYDRNAGGIEWLFSRYGKVDDVKIIVTPGTEDSKGYAFVKMRRSKDADKAIKMLDGKIVDGRTLKVSEAAPQNKTFKKKSNFSGPKTVSKKPKEIEEVTFKKKRKRNDLQDLLTHIGKA